VTDLLNSRKKNTEQVPIAKRRSFRGLARVDHVYRGSLDEKLIKITAPDSFCDIPFAAGDVGIVAGTPQLGEDGMVELVVVVESFDQRLERKKLKR
jgi:hypothetical protein